MLQPSFKPNMKQIILPIAGMGAVRTTQAGKFSDKRYKVYQVYKQALYALLASNGIKSCPAEFRITFVMPVFDSYTERQKQAKIGQPHTQKPDLDNLVKGFMDCFGKDDSGVHHIEMAKIWGEKGGIVLEIPE